MAIDVQLLRDALRSRASEDDPGADFVIERLGDEAFDWILGELRGGRLTPREQVRGSQLLSLLSRQLCLPRKGEMLDFMLATAQSQAAAVEVRSVAAQIAVMNAVIAKGLQDPRPFYGRSAQDVRALVDRAVRRALTLGVVPEMAPLIKDYLTAGEAPR